MTDRTCRLCGDLFTPHIRRRYVCKKCNAQQARAWYQQNRSRALARMRVYGMKHRAAENRDPTSIGRPRRQMVNGKLRCPRCKEWKEPELFYVNKRSTYGRSGACKSCHKLTEQLRYEGMTPEQKLACRTKFARQFRRLSDKVPIATAIQPMSVEIQCICLHCFSSTVGDTACPACRRRYVLSGRMEILRPAKPDQPE